MATSKVTSINADNTATRYFGHCTEVYRLKDGVEHGELSDAMSERIKQLKAATMVIHGEGFDAFECMASELRENYLWMVHSMISEIGDLWGAMQDIKAPARVSAA